MKVIIQCRTAMGDLKTVYNVLLDKNVRIIKTYGRKFQPYVKFEIMDEAQLNLILKALNAVCNYPVSLIKTRRW